MTTPVLKSRVAPVFPARVIGGDGIIVTASGGNIEIAADPTVGASNTIDYWTTMYKLLDPAAYTYSRGATQTWTVPGGNTWYALGLQNVNINGVGPYFHRKMNIFNAIELPAGTVVTSGASVGFIYYCDLAAAADPTGNPEEAFYSRLATLKGTPVSALSASISVGQAAGTLGTASFPGGSTYGIIRGVSCHDVAWVILTPVAGGLNTLDEISDDHQQRLTSSTLAPFSFSTFSGIMVRAASVSGNAVDTSLAGTGVVLYSALPANW
jgi:hypothetical protein